MENDLDLYNKYKSNINDVVPIPPYKFYNLSKIDKFNEVYGNTYEEYINTWKKVNNIIDIDVIKVVVFENNSIFKTNLYKTSYINSKGQIVLPNNMVTKGYYDSNYHNS